ncbi:MAG: autotransporter-associated beta strand repeat-containing protein [Verrucomicrobia bacterium]|nr:autotransporter-associated beta strand repeat-containing protein [Verrucomicrobiota bacterium]
MSKRLFQLCVGLWAICGSSDLRAAIVTWNAQSSTSGPSDGSGTWNQSNGNRVWWNGSSRVSWTDGNDAVFGSTTSGNYTIAIGANITVRSLTFNLSTYTIGSSSRTFTLSSGNATVAGGANATINQSISGSSGLTKLGAGTLTLGGANAYSGATTVSAGVLDLRNNAALGTTSDAASVAGGAALQVDGSGLIIAEPVSALVGSGISGGGALRNLANNNTWSGAITLGSGGARINSDGGTLILSGGISGAGQPLTVGGAGNVTISGVIGTTTGTLTKDGTGTLTLSGANTYSGATTVSSGTLRLGTAGAIGDTSDVSVSSGATFDVNGNVETIGSLAGAGNVTLGAGHLTTGGNNRSRSHSGAISGTGSLTKTGTGTFIFSGNNSYTGATTVNAGILRVTGNTATSQFTVSNGGTLGGTGTIGDFILHLGGAVSPGGSPGTLNSGSQTWDGGANYVWEINQAHGTKGADPGWDFLNIGGTLSIGAASDSKFNLKITSLSSGGSAGQLGDFDGLQNYAWTIATASGGIIGFDPLKFNLDASAFQNELSGGSFGITQSRNDLNLTFSAVPEPHEYAVATAVALLGFAAWRRSRQLVNRKS